MMKNLMQIAELPLPKRMAWRKIEVMKIEVSLMKIVKLPLPKRMILYFRT